MTAFMDAFAQLLLADTHTVLTGPGSTAVTVGPLVSRGLRSVEDVTEAQADGVLAVRRTVLRVPAGTLGPARALARDAVVVLRDGPGAGRYRLRAAHADEDGDGAVDVLILRSEG